ncbi:MAG: LPS-assembly protein LptD [Terriglobia bacterium]
MPTVSSAFPVRPARRGRGIFALLPVVLLNASLAGMAQQGCVVPPEYRNPQTTLTLRADAQKWANKRYTGRGHVVLTYREMRIAADRVTYDDASGLIEARGHVVFDDARGHLEAQEAQYNVRTGSGWFSKVHGYLRYASSQPGQPATSLFVRAEKITRVDQDTYTIEEARLSSCENPNRGLAFGLRRAKVEVGHNVTAHEALFRFVGVPVFYLPYVVVSAARKPRQTGFLVPEIGESTQKGFVAGDGFFWAINRSADLLLGLQDFSRRGAAFSGRFRATPSSTSKITADVFGIDDRASGSLRNIRAPGASFNVVGESDDLGDGFRGVVNVGYVNSLAFRTTWSNTFNTAVFSEATQSGFASKNFDAYSINLFASRYQDFLSAAPTHEQSIIIRRAPSVSFSGVDQQILHTPFFFGFESSLGGVGRSDPGFSTPTISERMDLFPHITLRSRPFWGFHLTPTAGVRETYYGTSLRPDHAPLNRFLGEFSVDLRPPSFEKVFSKSFFGMRLKHVIEPDIKYQLVKATDPQNMFDIVRFDTTDILTDDNEIEYSLTTAILGRKDHPAGQTQNTQSRDLISWTLTQKYFFDPTFGGAVAPGNEAAIAPTLSLTGFAFPEGRRWSPIDSVLRVSPVAGIDAELRADVDPAGGGLLNAGITSRLHSHAVDVALTDFFVSHTVLLPAPIAPNVPLTALPTFNLLDMMASHGDPSRKGLTEAFRVDDNLSQGIVEDFIGQASYNFGCFSLNAQYERFNLGAIRNENMFRLSVTLGNIGTFGSLKPGEFLQRQLRQIP